MRFEPICPAVKAWRQLGFPHASQLQERAHAVAGPCDQPGSAAFQKSCFGRALCAHTVIFRRSRSPVVQDGSCTRIGALPLAGGQWSRQIRDHAGWVHVSPAGERNTSRAGFSPWLRRSLQSSYRPDWPPRTRLGGSTHPARLHRAEVDKLRTANHGEMCSQRGFDREPT
jgi:hypothetical protein